MGQGVNNKQGKVEAPEGIIIDLSERKAIENTLKYNNEHDPWTGLYNRSNPVSLLKRHVRQQKQQKER